MAKLTSGLETIPYGCEAWTDIVRRNNLILDTVLYKLQDLLDSGIVSPNDGMMFKWNASQQQWVVAAQYELFDTSQSLSIFEDTSGYSNSGQGYVDYTSGYHQSGQKDYVFAEDTPVARMEWYLSGSYLDQTGKTLTCTIHERSGNDLGSEVASASVYLFSNPSVGYITFEFGGVIIPAGTYHICLSSTPGDGYMYFRSKISTPMSGNRATWDDSDTLYQNSATTDMDVKFYELVTTATDWMVEEFGDSFSTSNWVGFNSSYYYIGLIWQPSREFYLSRISGWLQKSGSPSDLLYAQLWSVSGNNLDTLLAESASVQISTISNTEYEWVDFDFSYPLIRCRDDREYAFVFTFKDTPGTILRLSYRDEELGTNLGRVLRVTSTGTGTKLTSYDPGMKVWEDPTYTTTSTSTTTTTSSTTTTTA